MDAASRRSMGPAPRRHRHPHRREYILGQGLRGGRRQNLLGYLFNECEYPKVELDTWDGNIRAIRCYEKCGFQIEGRLRGAKFIDGQPRDVILMGILREEYSVQ